MMSDFNPIESLGQGEDIRKHFYGAMLRMHIFVFTLNIFFVASIHAQSASPRLVLNDLGYFETRGFNVLVFSNWYDGNFSDAKMSGVELIHHGVRTATNGDVRLSPTPGQWDPTPNLVKRTVSKSTESIEVSLAYPAYSFEYTIKVDAVDGGIHLSVFTAKPLPPALEGLAGLNLEFLPSAYFGKTFMADGRNGTFPLYPTGPMKTNIRAPSEPGPIATGNVLVLAPEDPERRVVIRGKECTLSLFDGRNKAQNGWFVVRSLIPSGKTGKVVEWDLSANTLPGWIRQPLIAHSQVGYHPSQEKDAVIELDRNDTSLVQARLLKVQEDGSLIERIKGKPQRWGKYLRYNYLTFDFSREAEEGLYAIEYGGVRTKPFRIARDVYEAAWHPTLDVYFSEQMDHMFVREAYRVWHGASHLDDALQAPVNHEHFDLYAQGPTTDSPYQPGQHIPGLNVGGWFDAGDYDIRTQTQYHVVTTLVHCWETFHTTRDETTIDEMGRYVEMHRPDGTPDILQQIEHGTLQLLAQQKSVGHAINGIVESHLSQYTHLGDASTKTDNLIYNPKLDSAHSDGATSGSFDDRWAFTSKSTPLNYGSAAALAAASRALKGYRDSLSVECLATAKKVWKEEHSHPPDLFRHGNTTGGDLDREELHAAVELLLCTRDTQYVRRIEELWPTIDSGIVFEGATAVRALPYMNERFKKKLESAVRVYRNRLETFRKVNPFGVPISEGGWAGSGWVVGFAMNNYYLHKAFPDIIGAELVYRGLNYIYGCHPASDVSFVSGVGTVSKRIAYGNNRADYTFIAGGVVPGVLILKPDFPENKEDWPFIWSENEYVIGEAASYIFIVNAADELLRSSGASHK